MLKIVTRLVNFKTKEVVGVLVEKDACRLALDINKAQDIGVEDISIVNYLDVEEKLVAISSDGKSFAYLDEDENEFRPEYEDTEYSVLFDSSYRRVSKCVVWGYVFDYSKFIPFNSKGAMREVLGYVI